MTENVTDLPVPLNMGNNVTPISEQSKGELGLVIKDPKSIRVHTHFPRVIRPKFPTSKVSGNLSSLALANTGAVIPEENRGKTGWSIY